MPKCSLIVSTKHRDEIHPLLTSLAQQSMTDFEVIVVDQNDEDVLRDRVAALPCPTIYIHTPHNRGVSRGRNRGLEVATGEIVVFPDDDCWYPPDFLERAAAIMDALKLDALTGRPVDEHGNPILGRFEKTAQPITVANVWTTQIEWLAVWRTSIVRRVGGFDERIGVGADTPWQSAEGQDLMLRVLAAGGVARYDPSLVAHDAGVDLITPSEALRRKARAYGRGMGYVISTHGLGMRTAAKFLIRSCGGALFALLRGKAPLARYYFATATGRLEGLTSRCFGSPIA